MSTKEIIKIDFITKEFNKISEEAIKPMSILEIQKKFQLSFPFQVKRVRNSSEFSANAFPVGQIFTITHIWDKPCDKGLEFVTNNKGKINHQSAELKDYQLV